MGNVSLSQVYRVIPAMKRICQGCYRPIYRNVALMDGQLWHFGCLKKSEADPVAFCIGCGSYLSRGKISTVEISGRHSQAVKVQACGLCGSDDIRPLSWAEKRGVTVTFPHEALPDSYDPFREPWSGR